MAGTATSLPAYKRPRALPAAGYQNLPGFVRRRLDSRVEVDAPGDAPRSQFPGYNPERTPERDERLTGEGGAELGARQVPPHGSSRSYDARVAASGRPMDEEPETSPAYPGYTRGPAAQRLDDLLSTPATDRNGRLRSGALMALEGPRTPTDSLGNAAGQLLANFVGGLLHKNADEEVDRRREIALAVPAAQREAAEETRQLEREDARSQIDLRASQADWNRKRPGLEALKQTQTALQREISNRLREPRAFDPSDAYDSDLASRAQAAGVRFAPGAFGDYKNPFSLEVLDPSDATGTRKTRFVYDRDSGGFRPLAANGQPLQTNYVQPVRASGMTEAQERADADRDRGFTALERQRSVSNELQRAGLNLAGARFDFSKLLRDDRLSENARKEMGAAAKLRSEAEQAEMDARAFANDGMYTGDDGKQHQAKWAAQRYKGAQDKAEALRRQYFQTYGYLHAPDGGEMKMTMDEFRQLFPNAPNPSASAPSYGVVITDSTQPGTPHTNNYPPRRPAPRVPSSAAPSSAAPAQPKGRVSRANFGRVREQNPQLKNASDAEVEAALRAMGIEVY